MHWAPASGDGPADASLGALDGARGAFEEYALPTFLMARLAAEGGAAAVWCARAAARPWVRCVARSAGEERRGCPDTLTRFAARGVVRRSGPAVRERPGSAHSQGKRFRPMGTDELVQSLREERAAGVYSIKLDRARNSPVLLAVAQLARADNASAASSLTRGADEPGRATIAQQARMPPVRATRLAKLVGTSFCSLLSRFSAPRRV